MADGTITTDTEKIIVYHNLTRLTNWLVASTLIVFVAGVLAYGEKFSLWNYAYSYLGMLNTPDGSGNTISFLVYVAGNLLNSTLAFRAGRIIPGKFYQFLLKACSAGYLFLLLPCDRINSLHSLGGIIVFGSLWLFVVAKLNELFHEGHRFMAILYHIILQGSVLPYAFLYFAGSPTKQPAQKFALAGLILIMKLVFMEYRVIMEPGYDEKSGTREYSRHG